MVVDRLAGVNVSCGKEENNTIRAYQLSQLLLMEDGANAYYINVA